MHRAAVVTILVLLVRAGEGRAQAVSTPPAALRSVALPPALDRVLRDYEGAWRRGDAVGLAALFADDGFVLQGGRPPVRGRAAIQAAYAGQGGGPLRLRALAAATADSVGYSIGAYGYDDVPGELGKFTLTLRRGADGRCSSSRTWTTRAAPHARPARRRRSDATSRFERNGGRMSSWRARALGRAIRALVRREEWGDATALAGRARRVLGAPRAYGHLATIGLSRRRVRTDGVHGEWLVPGRRASSPSRRGPI